MIKQRENARTCWEKKKKNNTRKNSNRSWGNKAESTGERRKIKKISRKDKKNTKKTKHSKTTKENSSKLGEMIRKYTNNRVQEKLNNSGVKYGNHNKKADWISNIAKELEGHGFWFEKFTPIHDWLALEINKCLQVARTRRDGQRKWSKILSKEPLQTTKDL